MFFITSYHETRVKLQHDFSLTFYHGNNDE